MYWHFDIDCVIFVGNITIIQHEITTFKNNLINSNGHLLWSRVEIYFYKYVWIVNGVCHSAHALFICGATNHVSTSSVSVVILSDIAFCVDFLISNKNRLFIEYFNTKYFFQLHLSYSAKFRTGLFWVNDLDITCIYVEELWSLILKAFE